MGRHNRGSTRQRRGGAGVRRWTAEEASTLLAEWTSSGESLAAFSRERGFNGQRLRWWQGRLADRPADRRHRAARPGEPAILKLAPVVPSSADGVWSIGCAVSIVVGERDLRIEIHDSATVSAVWVGDIVRAIKAERAR